MLTSQVEDFDEIGQVMKTWLEARRPATAVPEPASMALFGAGPATVAWRRRRALG